VEGWQAVLKLTRLGNKKLKEESFLEAEAINFKDVRQGLIIHIDAIAAV
jgi:hypothetical protein